MRHSIFDVASLQHFSSTSDHDPTLAHHLTTISEELKSTAASRATHCEAYFLSHAFRKRMMKMKMEGNSQAAQKDSVIPHEVRSHQAEHADVGSSFFCFTELDPAWPRSVKTSRFVRDDTS